MTEESSTTTPIMAALQALAVQIAEMNATVLSVQCDVKELKVQQVRTNGKVHEHDVELARILEWRDYQARPAVLNNTERVFDLKVELARMSVKAASYITIAATSATIIALILKAFGVL